MTQTTEGGGREADCISAPGSFGEVQSARSARIEEDVSYMRLMIEIIKMSVPLGLASAAQNSVGVVMTAMVGRLVGVVQLGATSLACGLLNATAFSFAAGFCGALETVLSHSYGRDPNSKLYGVYAQRMVLMLLIIALFVGPLLAFSDSLLVAMKFNAEIAHYTGQYCRIALFGVVPVMMLELLRRYFACQHFNTQLSINLMTGAGIFPFFLWIFISIFGFLGAPIAWVLVVTLMPTSLLVYLVYTGQYKKTWGGWDPSAFSNWRPLLKLAFPSMAMMMSEWMSLEINSIMAAYASPVDLAAFSIVYQTSGLFWSLASGVFIEAAVLVGNALGRGRTQYARRCAFVCIQIAMMFAVFNLVVNLLFRYQIASLFSSDEAVQKKYVSLIKFFMVYHFFDCIQSCMMGVLRGCGMQSVGAIAIALVYSVVGVPLGAILFFKGGFGVEALWIGPGTGVSVVGFPLYCYIFFYHIKWDALEPREEEDLSLNSSMDERSLRTAGHSAPPSEDDTNEPSTAAERPLPSCRSQNCGTSSSASRVSTPTPANMEVDNSSFASGAHFHIPQRTILATPSFYANVPPTSPQQLVLHETATSSVNPQQQQQQ